MQEGDHQEAGHWQYTASPGATPQKPAEHEHSEDDAVQWTASEFIAHHKSFGWYLTLLVTTITTAGLLYLLLRDSITSVVVVVCGLVFGFYGARKPRVLPYRLDSDGLTIGNKFYPYGNYKSFSVVDEGSFASISFVPLKRFAPALSIYYTPEDEERIIETLAAYLPMQQHVTTIFDSIIHRIRF